MNRGLEKRTVFLDERDHRHFLGLLKNIWERWEVRILAYCLMRNHYHLFLQTPQGNIARIMRHVDSLYTQHFNRTRRRDGPLFRGRYKAILVDAEAYRLQLVRYIHLNPVKAGLVSDPNEYRWSSHHLYLSGFLEAPWLARDEVLSQFKGQEQFERFVAEGNTNSLEAFYKRQRFSPFLGSEPFLASMLNRLSEISSKDHPRSQRTPQFPTLQSIIQRVTDILGLQPETILASVRGRENVARNLAVYIASRKAGFLHREICKFFGLGTDSAVSRVCQRFETRLKKDTHLLEQLQALLK